MIMRRPLMLKGYTLSQRRHLVWMKRRRTLRGRMEKVKVEMKEISKEQENIRKGQREVKAKFERIESECVELRRETELIAQQSLNTQLRLALLFQILKARESNDFTKAAAVTHFLREVLARSK